MEQEKIEIPQIIYEGEDKKLKERIRKFRTGTLRIAIFTVVGFIMGFFSYTYVTDNFFPTKLIMAIPYKISEAIYVSVLGTDAAVRGTEQYYLFYCFTEFFPHSYFATWLAERVTPVLLGGAIYGSLAYFTGDKRVFTLRRFLGFAGAWAAFIMLFIGTTYAVNAKAVADNEALRGEPVFTLYDVEGKREFIHDAALADLLKQSFYKELEPAKIQRSYDDEVYLGIYFHPMRYTVCRVNYKENYIVAEKGTTYRISEEFADIAGNYAENHILPEATAEADMEAEQSAETEERAEENHEKDIIR